MSVIEIRQPRYHDNTVLIATYKVKSGYNYLKFTDDSRLAGKLYRFHSTDIDTSRVQSNGKIIVYILPMSKLELVQEEEPVEAPPQPKTIKIDIGGVSREFDSAEDFIKELAKFLAREGV